jgi:hypothetical protein
VEAHGGSIAVESGSGAGATFRIRLDGSGAVADPPPLATDAGSARVPVQPFIEV